MEVLCLSPLLLDDVPYPLNGVQHGAVGGQEHVAESGVVEAHDWPSFVYREVVLHYNGGVIAALELEALHEVEECLGVVAALEDLIVN